MANGDELTGTISSLTGTAVTIESQGQKLTVDLPRIAAVAFDPSLSATPHGGRDRVLVGLRDGSRIVVASVVANEKEAQLTMPDRTTWAVPAEALVCLEPLAGTAKYLSDLTAESYRHLPFLSQSWPYRGDANATGTQLRRWPSVCQRDRYAQRRGLTYRLDKRFRRFAAEVALDDQVAKRGAAVFGSLRRRQAGVEKRNDSRRHGPGSGRHRRKRG